MNSVLVLFLRVQTSRTSSFLTTPQLTTETKRFERKDMVKIKGHKTSLFLVFSFVLPKFLHVTL